MSSSKQYSNSDYDDLAADLVGALISNASPEETASYRQIVSEYRDSLRTSAEPSDHPLAFGGGDLVTTVTPYLFEASKVVVAFLIAQFAASAKEATIDLMNTATRLAVERIKVWLEQLAHGKPETLITAEQAKTLRARVRKRLQELNADTQTQDDILRSIDEATAAS